MCTGPLMPVKSDQCDQCLSRHLSEHEHGMWDQVQPLPQVTSSLWNAVCATIMSTSAYGVLALMSSWRHSVRKTTNTTSMPWLFIWKTV